MHLVNGTGNSPSPGQLTPGVVKQDKSSRGSVDTTKPRLDPQRDGMYDGERPMLPNQNHGFVPPDPPLLRDTNVGCWRLPSNAQAATRQQYKIEQKALQ